MNFRAVFQGAEITPRIDERFLGNLLALGEVATQAVGHSTDKRLILPDDAAEGIGVPGQALFDKGGF